MCLCARKFTKARWVSGKVSQVAEIAGRCGSVSKRQPETAPHSRQSIHLATGERHIKQQMKGHANSFPGPAERQELKGP